MDKITESLGVIFAGILVVVGLAVLLAFPTMLAWNYTMPYLFGFKEITVFQGLALNYLSVTLIQSSLSKKK